MAKHLFVLGHGQGPNRYDPGAKGNGTCEDEFLNKEFLPHLKKHAPSNVDFYTTKNMYAYEEALTISGYDSITELHLDWANGASGGHVIIYKDFSPDDVDKGIRDVVKNFVGLRMSSGISYRSDLFNLKTFANRGITYRLVELGFINNAEDMRKVRENINAYAAAIVGAVTGSKVKLQADSVNPIKAPEPKDNGRYRLATGPFHDAEALGKAHDKLKGTYGWMIYEKADDTNFDPALRLWTGTFIGENVAKYYATELQEQFGWTVYVKKQ